MRQDPPVSVPMPSAHIPSATETAAPDDDPPGMRPVCAIIRRERRSVVRIEADARIGELRHIGSPDHDEAFGLEPRDGRRIRLRRRLVFQYHRPDGRHLAGNVEEILDRYRNARIARQLRLAPPQPVDIMGRLPRSLLIDAKESALAPSPAASLIRASAVSTSATRSFAPFQDHAPAHRGFSSNQLRPPSPALPPPPIASE